MDCLDTCPTVFGVTVLALAQVPFFDQTKATACMEFNSTVGFAFSIFALSNSVSVGDCMPQKAYILSARARQQGDEV